MIKDVWESFKDNIKERATNPFLGTFALVWIVHNWRVVYAFFYFDKDWKLQNKIEYFNKYWKDQNFIWNLFIVSLIAVGIIVITYFFLAFSRFLSNYFENIVIPWIYKHSKGKTVTFETHQRVLQQLESVEGKVELERKAKNEAIAERDQLEKLLAAPKEIIEETNSNHEFNKVISEANTQFEKVAFEKTMLGIAKKDAFKSDNPIIDFLLKYGFIQLERKSSTGSGVYCYYNFTQEGVNFKGEYFKT